MRAAVTEAVGTVALLERDAARLHHSSDEVVQFGERLRGRLTNHGIERFPFGDPEMLVESRLLHEQWLPAGARARNLRPPTRGVDSPP